MTSHTPDQSDPASLARLLEVSNGNDVLWRPEELAAILRHQLAAPIEYDLSAMGRDKAHKLRTSAASKGLLLKSFADLLHHPHPPLELLAMTKQFAKAARADPKSSVPVEITTLLYYACIAAALVRCRERITGLDDAAIKEGFEWGRTQPWVDEATAGLFTAGLEALQAPDELTGDAT
ncbi:MAG: hypothetical protein ACE5EX_09950 [Phycisphaerae bacterium]